MALVHFVGTISRIVWSAIGYSACEQEWHQYAPRRLLHGISLPQPEQM